MIYGYIRVSSDKQTTENQRFEISNYAMGARNKNRPVDRRDCQFEKKPEIPQTLGAYVQNKGRGFAHRIRIIPIGTQYVPNCRHFELLHGKAHKAPHHKGKLRARQQYRFKSARVRIRARRGNREGADFPAHTGGADAPKERGQGPRAAARAEVSAGETFKARGRHNFPDK